MVVSIEAHSGSNVVDPVEPRGLESSFDGIPVVSGTHMVYFAGKAGGGGNSPSVSQPRLFEVDAPKSPLSLLPQPGSNDPGKAYIAKL